jgi:hypothetical protein
MKNCFLPALAAVVMLASCQKDGTQTPVETGAKKSVTVTITNITGPATRAVQDAFTPAGVPVAKLADLNVLFADADGKVVETRALGTPLSTEEDVETTIIDPDGTGTSYEYTFHRVAETAVKLVVTNLTGATLGNDLDNLTSTMNGLALSSYQGAYTAATALPTIPVWGESAGAWASVTTTTDPDGFPHFDAGEVEVAPKLARIEIGNIQCIDLANGTASPDGFIPRFGSFDLKNIGIHNTSLTTIGGGVYNYTATDAGRAAWDGDVTGPDPKGWNIDPVGDVNFDSADDKIANKVFGFNVAPGVVPNIILELTNAVENTTGSVVIPGDVDPDDYYFVKSKSLNETIEGVATPISTFKAGYIYRVDFKFRSGNVLPWDEKEEFVCVDVTVVIPDWVIYDEEPLTPGFN